MSNIRLDFDYPWLLLLIIPSLILALIPHLKLDKHRRRTRNRITSLVLHIIVLVLSVLLLSGMNIKVDNSLKKNDVIFLVDVSDSSKNVKENIDNYLENIVSNYQYENRIGFVAFGNGQINAGKLNSNIDLAYEQYKNDKLEISKDATNFEEALKFSVELLEDKSGRIIILTDGKETDGNAVSLAESYTNQDIQIDAVYFDSTLSNLEVQVNEIKLEEDIKLNILTNIKVYIQSNFNSISTLNLYDNDQLIKSEALSTKKGITEYSLDYKFTTYGSHKLKATVEIKDSFSNNNSYYAVVNITDQNKVLIIDGTNNESNKLKNLISNEYQVDVISPSQASAYSEILNNYGEVILMNVSNTSLVDSFASKLETYVMSGGSLLTTGGKNTYYFGEMAGTRFSNMLPIEININENQPIGIFIIIDNSSSMDQKIGGSLKTKLQLAKEGAIESIKALHDYDYVGVITFDATPEVIVPLTPVAQKEEIFEEIEKIEIGYGTKYVDALNLAAAEYIKFQQSQTKHILFISDGVPTDTGYTDRLASMRTLGITASTFGIGDDVNLDKLEEFATVGGGNSYKITAAHEFKEYMVEETLNKKSEYLNEGTDYTPKIVSYTSVLQNITSLPSLGGYIGATPKETATTIIACDKDPIYCEWVYGSGKVGSFMSDLSGEWSNKYYEDSRGILFINNLVRSLFADGSTRQEMIVSLEDKNFSKIIQVRTSSNNNRNRVSASVKYPDGTKKEYALNIISNNTYSAILENFNQSGIYEITLKKIEGRDVIEEVFYITSSYSSEYNAFISQDECYSFLSKICQFTGGDIYDLEEELFTEENQRIDYEIDLRYVLLITTITLFILDIVVRKFKFKWPHELFNSSKKEG